MNYTHSEKTVKKHPPSYAFEQAKKLLNGASVCTNALRKYADDQLLTVVEINDLVNQLVDDSKYHNF